MIRQIVLWLLRSLETSLDPDLQLRIQQYEEKVAAQEAEEKRLLAEIQLGENRIQELNAQTAANKLKAIAIEDAIAKQNAETAQKKAQLDNLSDSDAVRVDL